MNKDIRSLPLVDSPDNMILLGSVQRYELIKMIDRHIGREKRLEVAAKWKKEAEERAKEEERMIRETETERQRRPSRFEVSPAPDILKLRQIANNEISSSTNNNNKNDQQPSAPKKSILKKTNSFTFKGFNPLATHSPLSTPYTTITGAFSTENRIRSAFDIIFKKSATLQDVQPQDVEGGSSCAGSIMTGLDSVPHTPGISKKVQLPRERVCDMSPEDQKAWEMEEMEKSINLHEAGIHIDPAPFQLVERTSILKVHSLFSMVGINHAYVTKIGRLVGVVALKEVGFLKKFESRIQNLFQRTLLYP